MSLAVTWRARPRPVSSTSFAAWVWRAMAPLWLSAWTSSCRRLPSVLNETLQACQGADALIWEELEQNAGEETRLSVSYLTFMVVAMLIASIDVLVDQPILIVGAMVVGPEFGPLV